MRDADDIVTFEEARANLGFDEAELFRWVSEGLLRAYRMDPDVRFRASVCDALTERRRAARARKFVPLAEAVELSGLGVDTLMQFMLDGAVSAFRSDRDVFFRKDEMRLLRMAEDGPAGTGNGAATAVAEGTDAELTLDEAAARTGLSRFELACLVDSGELEATGPAARMVFRRRDLEVLRGARSGAGALSPERATEALLRLSAAVGFRTGPGGSADPKTVVERVRGVAWEFGLVADTLEDLLTGLVGLLAERAAERRR